MNPPDDQPASDDANEHKPESKPSKLVRFDFAPGATPEQIAEALRKLVQGEQPEAEDSP